MSSFSKKAIASAAAATLRRTAESYLDVTTTVVRNDGSTDDGSGGNLNKDVPGQDAVDAGKTRENPSVNASRLPGELPDGVQTPKPGVNTESTMSHQLNERSSAVGLFAGCTVQVKETKSGKTVERHAIVTGVKGREVTVQGGETYSQDQYTFVRMA